MANSLLRIGDFARWEAPVLCVEPMARFDNGGDQGQTMYTPNASWGSPQYYASQMIASTYRPWLVPVKSVAYSGNSHLFHSWDAANSDSKLLDVVVVTNDDATNLVARVVNPATVDVDARIVVS